MRCTKIKVRYSEVDKMSRAYYANYLVWFEVARTDLLRYAGVVYSELENEDSVFLPVREAYCKFKKAIVYDEDLEIDTAVEIMDKKRVKFYYKIYGAEKNDLKAIGYTIHVFINAEGKTLEIPEKIKKAVEFFK
jgi:acyl-CoA thioester hydrolase